jgi:hypothetical protein
VSRVCLSRRRGSLEGIVLESSSNRRSASAKEIRETLTIVSPEMHLSPNVGSDRSWVWNVAADFAEGSDHTNETLAIRFGNSESELHQL